MGKHKKVFEALNQMKTQYEENTHEDKINETERQKRMYQIDEALNKYRDFKIFLDDPTKYQAKIEESQYKFDLEEQRDARDGEYSYTRGASNQELMKMARQKDKDFNSKMGKAADNVSILKQEANN